MIMAIAKKEVLYWISCFLYGAVLTGALLYIRFPADKFRRYFERVVEEKVPETSCSIAKIQYLFPFRLALEEVRITRGEDKELLYLDPLFSFMPIIKDPMHRFEINSAAYGGSHRAQIRINPEEESVEMLDVDITGVSLDDISFFHSKLDRKMTGALSFSGNAQIDINNGLKIVAAAGVASVNEGEFHLKKPILELNSIELEESSVHFTLAQGKIALSKGEVKNSKLKASFAGDIVLAMPWLASSMAVKGEIVPLMPLYQENKQLRVIVSRMQKRYKTKVLPYNVNGTVGRPTFTFGN